MGPLAGVRVLDFSWAAAGPIVSSIMALLGADVAKVEWGKRPDLMRTANKQYGYAGDLDLEASPSFAEIAAGKRSIELNLLDEKDRQTALRLAEQADVVLENMRPGKIEALGLGYEDIRSRNPGVIMCSQSATGRGASGVPGYAPIFWAEGGAAWLTGWPYQRPGVSRGPVDMHAGAYALIGVCALLHRRRETGRGGYIDNSGIESVVATMGSELLQTEVGLPQPVRSGNRWPGFILQDVYPCHGDDQWIAVTISDNESWQQFCDVIGASGIAERMHDHTLSIEDAQEEIFDLVSKMTRRFDPVRLEALLTSRGVPAAHSLSLARARRESRLASRGVWQQADHPKLGSHVVVGLPWQYDSEPYDLARSAPLLGADADDIIHEWLD